MGPSGFFGFTRRRAITPHDTIPLPHPVDSIYVGGAGTVVVKQHADDGDQVFVGVPAGGYVTVRGREHEVIIKVASTATSMLAQWG